MSHGFLLYMVEIGFRMVVERCFPLRCMILRLIGNVA
jgi:hypothetical protein